jgi:hypothetical protein
MIADITRHLQIWSAVGKDAPNLETDVGRIQVLLRLARLGGHPLLVFDGKVGPALIDAITGFQKEVMKVTPDGKVEPVSATFRALLEAAAPKVQAQTRFPIANGHRGHLTNADYAHAAAAIGCHVEAIKAVSEVESMGAPFLPSGKPKILFEPQIFGARTHHRYDFTFPDLSRRHRLGEVAARWLCGLRKEQAPRRSS